MLCVLTPTGARPEAFAKCVEYMQAQTYADPVRWIIVDDGPEAMPTPAIEGWQVAHVRPHPLWEPGQNTQSRNLLEGLALVDPGDRVVIVEDDDQYAPWWLERVNEWLDSDDLVGEGGSVYYNLKTGARKECGNTKHASLCQTAVKGRGIEALREACKSGEKFIDTRLWRAMPGKVYPAQGGVIGIKGYPGRPGIGIGHRI